SQKLQIKIRDKKLCPRYTGRIITDVKVGPSPKWLQDRLISVGLRPVNNIVDITNFALMETGQPMHAFDLDKIKGDIEIRKAKKGEVVKTIDGINRTLEDGTLVIADNKGPIAIAGIMGSLDTEVSGRTKNILLESACFDPVSARRTSRILGLSSESSYRFERRIDRGMVLQASERAAFMIEDLAKGKKGRLIDIGEKSIPSKIIKFNPKGSNTILGIDIPTRLQKDILKSLGFSIKPKKDSLEIKVPSSRGDITQEVDITEEIARIYGYNKIPMTIPKIIGHTRLMDKGDLVKKEIRRYLSSIGLNEIITYNLVSTVLLDEFYVDKNALAHIQNPLSREQGVLAGILLPGMLKIINWNINRKNKNLRLFEIGKIYKRIEKKKFKEELHLSMAITGLVEDNWLSAKRKTSFFDLKGILVDLLGKIGVDKVKFRPTDKIPYFSTAASIECLGDNIGVIGKLDGEILKKFDIDETMYALEISLEEISKKAVLEKRFKAIPKFPSILRDISLVAEKDMPAESIVSAIREIGSDIVKEITLVDMYRGKQIPQDKQGLLYRIEYRDDARTLTDLEVEEFHNKIKQNLSAKLGIFFR
ncbi:MAG: phenylalanine--tRNA ligase subunit beta, partial [Candidatus Omnitrophica bacterium]|nr:phenylalanine--tRNA ligase subunit beta [Candidatus Omnitrophota bacterium]